MWEAAFTLQGAWVRGGHRPDTGEPSVPASPGGSKNACRGMGPALLPKSRARSGWPWMTTTARARHGLPSTADLCAPRPRAAIAIWSACRRSGFRDLLVRKVTDCHVRLDATECAVPLQRLIERVWSRRGRRGRRGSACTLFTPSTAWSPHCAGRQRTLRLVNAARLARCAGSSRSATARRPPRRRSPAARMPAARAAAARRRPSSRSMSR